MTCICGCDKKAHHHGTSYCYNCGDKVCMIYIGMI